MSFFIYRNDAPVNNNNYNGVGEIFNAPKSRWDDKELRLAFIQKVFGILSAQLLITAFLIGVPMVS